MKAYLVTTATLFALIAVLHLWRVFEERSSLGRDPWFLIITVIAAALSGWAISLLRRPAQA
jgi:cytochrome bd-type quinol oxidase subunit 1